MTKMKVFDRVTSGLRASSSWDYKTALCVISLTACVSIVRLVFSLGFNYGFSKGIRGNHTDFIVGFSDSFVMPVIVGLIVSTVCLRLRKAGGFFLSMLALVWVWYVYWRWHLSTLSIMREEGARDFSQLRGLTWQRQHVLTLYEATWWDLVVLSVTIILFVWHLKMLISILKSPRSISHTSSF